MNTHERLSRKSLAQEIFKSSYLTGSFKLRSGKTSNEYFDKYQFESSPHLLAQIAFQFSELIREEFDALGGLEMGGIPLATSLALQIDKPLCFIRKEAKSYGTCRIAEGYDFSQKKILLIEDVITTGGQVVESAQILRSQGAAVSQVLCVIDRSNGEASLLKENGLELKALFTMNEIKNFAADL